MKGLIHSSKKPSAGGSVGCALLKDQEGYPPIFPWSRGSALGALPVPGVVVYHLDDLVGADMLAEVGILGGEDYMARKSLAEVDESAPEELISHRVSLLDHINLLNEVVAEQLNEGFANTALVDIVEDTGNANGKCAGHIVG